MELIFIKLLFSLCYTELLKNINFFKYFSKNIYEPFLFLKEKLALG